jgi:ABC-2 type transport system permease protein
MMALRSALRTIRFLVRKEALQVFRDRVMVFQIFAAPIIQLLIISQAATFEVRDTRMAVVDEDRSPASERLVERFTASGRLRVEGGIPTMAAADRALLTREVGVVLHLPEGFERDLRRRGLGEVQLVLNAEDGAAAGVVAAYATRILDRYGTDEGAALRPVVARAGPGLAVVTRGRFNLQGDYLPFMSVGILALLVTLIGTMLTAQNLAREKERGTLEQLNATPITRGQFIAGKLIPFWILGLVEFTVGLLIIRWAFGVPFVGNVGVAYLGAAVYLVAALGIGLLISTTVQTQQQAQFVTFFVLVIYLFMSGLFTPVQSMPHWAQVVAEFNPIKHFIVITRGVILKGAGLGDLLVPFAVLSGFAVLALSLAVLRYRKTAA